MQPHLPARLNVATRASSNREYCIGTIIIVWPLDRNLTLREEHCPETLPFRLTNDYGANAMTVVVTYLLLVGCIEDGIMEAEDITQRVIWRMKMLNCIRNRVLNYMDRLLT